MDLPISMLKETYVFPKLKPRPGGAGTGFSNNTQHQLTKLFLLRRRRVLGRNLALSLLLRWNTKELPCVGALHFHSDGKTCDINKLMFGGIRAVHKSGPTSNGCAKGRFLGLCFGGRRCCGGSGFVGRRNSRSLRLNLWSRRGWCGSLRLGHGRYSGRKLGGSLARRSRCLRHHWSDRCRNGNWSPRDFWGRSSSRRYQERLVCERANHLRSRAHATHIYKSRWVRERSAYITGKARNSLGGGNGLLVNH